MSDEKAKAAAAAKAKAEAIRKMKEREQQKQANEAEQASVDNNEETAQVPVDAPVAGADEKSKAAAAAKAKAAAAAKAKAAAAAKAKAAAAEGSETSEEAPEAPGTDEKAKAKAAAAAKAKAAAAAKANGQEDSATTGDDDEKAKAKAAAVAKAKAAAAAKLKAQGESGGAEDDEKAKAKAAAVAKAKAAAAAKAKAADGGTAAAEAVPEEAPSKNQPILDKYVRVIKENLGENVLEAAYINKLSKDVPTLVVTRDSYLKVAQFLKHNEQMSFDYLSELHGSDFETHMEIYNHFFSFKTKENVAVKVKIDRDQPEIDSLASIWEGANWPEREAYDLLGIIFTGHPNLTRIMLSDDWVGHPLRKDYEQHDEEV